jgi:hypothetical protein
MSRVSDLRFAICDLRFAVSAIGNRQSPISNQWRVVATLALIAGLVFLFVAGCGGSGSDLSLTNAPSVEIDPFFADGQGEEMISRALPTDGEVVAAARECGEITATEEAGLLGATRAEEGSDPTGAVVGRVGQIVGGDPRPVPDALVVLLNPDGTDPGLYARTNEQGAYALRNVPPGLYVGIALKRGFEPSAHRVGVRADQTTRAYFVLHRLPIRLHGKGALLAVGQGLAVLEGQGTIIARQLAGPGELRIRKDSEIRVFRIEGRGRREETAEFIIYRGFEGRAFIVGPKLHVELQNAFANSPSDNPALMQLLAVGQGQATLSGQGWYRTKSGPGVWTPEGVVVEYQDPVDDPDTP